MTNTTYSISLSPTALSDYCPKGRRCILLWAGWHNEASDNFMEIALLDQIPSAQGFNVACLLQPQESRQVTGIFSESEHHLSVLSTIATWGSESFTPNQGMGRAVVNSQAVT